MYGWLFRHLPGPLWVRIIITVILLVSAVLVLMQFVFPWLNQFNPLLDSTIGGSPTP